MKFFGDPKNLQFPTEFRPSASFQIDAQGRTFEDEVKVFFKEPKRFSASFSQKFKTSFAPKPYTECVIILFSDMLIIAKEREPLSNSFVVVALPILLNEIELPLKMLEDVTKLEICNKKFSHVLQFSDQRTLKRWVDLLETLTSHRQAVTTKNNSMALIF